eukprot:9511196-Heterocapsa_arctica.AAC.1
MAFALVRLLFENMPKAECYADWSAYHVALKEPMDLVMKNVQLCSGQITKAGGLLIRLRPQLAAHALWMPVVNP